MKRPGALVTGAGRGIGEAIARRLAADGYRVAVNDVDRAVTERLAREIGGVAAPADVSDPRAVDRMTRDVATGLGRLDVVVNNAGIEARAPLADHDIATWERVLAVNLTGPFLVSQAAAGALAERSGTIINIASTAVIGFSGQVAYDVSKGGVLTLTRSLAVELGPLGIRANAVCPGFIATDMVEESGLAAVGRRVTARNPIARMGLPEEIAGVVSFLASSDASYITGQGIVVDGGWVR